MTGHEIRQRFLDYFKRQGHTIAPSASLVPDDDPTLLFTGAGMNQFKDYFLGKRKDMKRAASCQKCFRTPDLEHVGKTGSHLTFFEMLGNFSFGDYFKREAIQWGWEFFTKEMGLPAEKLWATVYEQDDEALGIWRNVVKIPAARINKLGAKENFWPSNAPTDGPNGPCGPCSEIHYDYGSCTPGQRCPDPDRCQPGCPCGRFVEIWNLVFTQFDRQSDGRLAPLPAKNIDTGMGLERLTAVVNGLRTNFDTDLLKPIVDAASHEVGKTAPASDVRAIADHVRALTFLISDGVVPSNDGRGYVVRMLLRKAARHGRAVGIKDPFLYRLVAAVVKAMAPGYPELTGRREHVAKVIKLEEERYQQTLEEKLPILEAELKQGLTAERAAWLYDTHGLPYEEMARAAQAARARVPARAQFDEALAALQAKSKATNPFGGTVFAETLSGQIAALGVRTEFIGDSTLKGSGKVVALLQDGRPVDQAQAPGSALVLLDQTVFFGESGGQVGDAGELTGPNGRMVVEDTKRVDETIVHVVRIAEGRVRLHDPVEATVNPSRRRQVARNHTATHLLHAALRTILGPQVHQAGSLVAPDRLRFDFTHAEQVAAPRLRQIEDQVNEWALGNFPVLVHVDVPIEKAKAAGALAFFGDKYGDRVRMVEINGFSRELCGGTHLRATGEVGMLTIVDEGSVASGIRRVEALTGESAIRHLKGAEGQLLELAQLLKTPREKLSDAVERLRQQTKALQVELDRLRIKDSQSRAREWLSAPLVIDQTKVYTVEVEGAGMPELRQLYDVLKQQAKSASIFCLGSKLVDQAYLAVGVSGDLVERGVTAPAIIQELAPIIGGKGGGRPEFAQAGGRDVSKLSEAMRKTEPVVKKLLKAAS